MVCGGGTAGGIGRVSERWRYRVEKFVCARRSALSQQANSPIIDGNGLECDDGGRTVVDDLAGDLLSHAFGCICRYDQTYRRAHSV